MCCSNGYSYIRQVRHWSHMLAFGFEIYCTVLALAVAITCGQLWGGQVLWSLQGCGVGRRRLAGCSSSGSTGWGRPGDIECACSLIH